MTQFIEKRLQVFISSTYLDLKEERQAAVKAILEVGHIPAGMELFTGGDESQMEAIKQWIETSDVYLLILGGRYGSLDPNSGKSYTHLEYEYAVEQKKTLFACVLKDDYLEEKIKKPNVNSKDIREQDNQDKFREFKSLVMSKMVFQCGSFLEIENSIIKKMNELGRNKSLIGWIRSDESNNSSLLSEEVARLSKENHELRDQLEVMNKKKQDLSSNLMIHGIHFDDIIKILSTTILLDKDFIGLSIEIDKIADDFASGINTKDLINFFQFELIGGIKSNKISSVLDLVYTCSDRLLMTELCLERKSELDAMKIPRNLGSSTSTHLLKQLQVSAVTSFDLDSLFIKKVFSIPKLKILFGFNILSITKEILVVSKEGQSLIKYIKGHKTKELYQLQQNIPE
jgi:hypothetical protein